MSLGRRALPDHATIARFLRRRKHALSGLFGSVLALCARAGLVASGVMLCNGRSGLVLRVKAQRALLRLEDDLAEVRSNRAYEAWKAGGRMRDDRGRRGGASGV